MNACQVHAAGRAITSISAVSAFAAPPEDQGCPLGVVPNPTNTAAPSTAVKGAGPPLSLSFMVATYLYGHAGPVALHAHVTPYRDMSD